MEMEMEQIMQFLQVFKKWDTYHKKWMTMLDVPHEKTLASLGKTEAMDFTVNPGGMHFVTEHHAAPKEDAIVIPVKERRKRHMGLEAICRATWRSKGTDPRRLWRRRNCPSHAGGCTVVQQWRSARETFLEKFRLKKIVDRRGNFPPPSD
jgi:hypothetical protein